VSDGFVFAAVTAFSVTWIAHSSFFFAAVNIFKGILDNPLFCGILLVTAVLQVLIVQFGSIAFRVSKDGLSGQFWGLSLVLGAISLPFQQVINFVYHMCKRYHVYKNKKRKRKAARLISERINGGDHVHSE